MDKFRESILVQFAGVLRRNWMVRILREEFAKFRGPSDLAEEQEGYDGCFSTCKLKRNRAIGFEPTRALDHSRNLISRFRELEN